VAVPSVRHHDRGGEQVVGKTSSAGSSPGKARRDPGFPGPVPEEEIGYPDRRGSAASGTVLRDSVHYYPTENISPWRERVKGEKTVSLYNPRGPAKKSVLRTALLPDSACGRLNSTLLVPSRDSPLRGQRSAVQNAPAILSCLDSPLSAIPGGQPLSSVLRFADFSGARALLHDTLFQKHIRSGMKISRRRRCRACPATDYRQSAAR
jgi:hypothetical protein